MPAVGLQLGLPGAPGADGPLLPLQVLPHPQQPGQQVAVLGQLHLQSPLPGAGPAGKDVQDQGGAVQHRHPQILVQGPLLGGGEAVVKDHHPRLQGLQQLLDLPHLALADEAPGVGGLPVLQEHPRAAPPRRLQQGGQLLQGGVRGVLLRGQGVGAQAYQDGSVDIVLFHSAKL